MKRIVLILVLLPILVFSQNYQTIQPGVEVYFNPESSFNIPLYFLPFEEIVPLRALKMSLVDTGEDEIFFTNHTEIHNDEYSNQYWITGCRSPFMLSWIGNDVFLKDDGYNVFFNRLNDSIFIDTQAQLEESYVFYNYPDGSYFLATIADHDILSFFNVTDSAKTINLQFFTSDNQAANSPINDKEIIITKNYGFYKTFNFRDFPDFEDQSFPLLEHVLYGHENIPTSFSKLIKRDIFDFEVGDKYHYETEFYVAGPYSSWYNYKTWHIANKEWLSNDSVKYTIYEQKWGFTGPAPEGVFFHYIDTISATYSQLDSAIKNALPFEPVSLESKLDDHLTFFVIKTNEFNNHPTLCTTSDGYAGSDSCYYGTFEDTDVSNTLYIKGCGILENYYDPYSEYSIIETLNYYKKGDEEWGTPLTPPTIGVLENPNEKQLISVFPNPGSNYIHFNIPDKFVDKEYRLVIVDSKGLKQIEKKITPSNNSIYVSNWNEGIYFYYLSNNSISERGKILVKH